MRAAESQGWDNRTFRLGAERAVRLPSADRYAAQVAKEWAWLPKLAPHLPLPIPSPVAAGAPGEGYPWPWSIYRWMEGETARTARIADMGQFARDLAAFLRALQTIDPTGGPAAGAHSFWRGGPLATYDRETRDAIAALGAGIDVAGATAVWEAALAATWQGPPVWFHGDVATGNLLVDAEGRLSGVIDFGCSGVGDPACDLVIAWTFFEGDAREAFREGLGLDAGAWARGRGWALWKALIVLAAAPGANPMDRERAPDIIAAIVSEHRAPPRTDSVGIHSVSERD